MRNRSGDYFKVAAVGAGFLAVLILLIAPAGQSPQPSWWLPERQTAAGAHDSPPAVLHADTTACLPAPGPGSTATPGPAGWPGQSNVVPPGYPTPITHAQRLAPGHPPLDPGPLNWAVAGPYIAPGWTDFSVGSFSGDERLVTTYYFYWHDLTDPARRARYESGAFRTPPDLDRYSFLFPDKHLRDFGDMVAAGIDFVLPVYWGEPGHPGRTTGPTCPHYWSTDGIPFMVEALETLADIGTPLKIGMFYDTTILANADLTTLAGKEYFYVNVRDFYSRIPPRHWAAIGGKPVVWLYDAIWVTGFDQSSFDYLARRFTEDFGGLRPYVVREVQWHSSRNAPPHVIQTDGLYAWGAAAFGYNPDPRLTVAQVGPGFSNTAYCTGGPERNCFDVDRQGGAFYEQALRTAVESDRKILAVETWNEFSEGSEIAETRQDGRRYIELTRSYAAEFKRGAADTP